MSGIEVAGLVLASLPLIVSALEHYDRISDPKYIFDQFRGQLGRATRKLRVQHTLFEQSIEILLRPITSDDERAEMIDNSASKLWTDFELDKDLQQRLGRAYTAYMQTVETIQATMVDLAAKLEGVKGAEQVARLGLKAIIEKHAPAKVDGQLSTYKFTTKVRFTMKRRRIKEALSELQDYVDTIQRFQDKADMIMALTEPDAFAGAKQTFKLCANVIRDNVRKLHSVLAKTWCPSAHRHRAGLLLEPRLIKKKRRARSDGPAAVKDTVSRDSSCFGVSLSRTPTNTTRAWLDAEIRFVEPVVSVKTTSKVTIVAPDDGLPYDAKSLTIVTNMCTMIVQPCYPCMGFVIEGETLRGTYQAVSAMKYADEGLTLQQVMEDGSYSRGIGSSLPDSYGLSITLVSSLLQLSHTPWLSDNWTKDNIMFLRNRGGCCRQFIDIRQPYLIQEHNSPGPAMAMAPVRKRSDSENLAALGVILLELCHGYAIESQILPEDQCPSLDRTKVFAALRILNSEGRTWMRSYQQAIQFCLDSITKPNASFLDQDFVKDIEQRVLAPLQRDLDFLL